MDEKKGNWRGEFTCPKSLRDEFRPHTCLGGRIPQYFFISSTILLEGPLPAGQDPGLPRDAVSCAENTSHLVSDGEHLLKRSSL